MELDFERNESTLIVHPTGRIDSVNAGDLGDAIKEKITDDITEVRIDMEKIDYVSSKGIRILLILHRFMQPRGRLVLTNLNNSVKEVLRLSALLKTFNIE